MIGPLGWWDWKPFPANPLFYVWDYDNTAATTMAFFDAIGVRFDDQN